MCVWLHLLAYFFLLYSPISFVTFRLLNIKIYTSKFCKRHYFHFTKTYTARQSYFNVLIIAIKGAQFSTLVVYSVKMKKKINTLFKTIITNPLNFCQFHCVKVSLYGVNQGTIIKRSRHFANLLRHLFPFQLFRLYR